MKTVMLVLLSSVWIPGQGSTYFHYLPKEAGVALSCGTCLWQVDSDFDQAVDCNLSRAPEECERGCYSLGEELCAQIQRDESGGCHITVRKGLFACVTAFTSREIAPFERPAHHVHSFLVVPDMLSEQVTNASVQVSAGESVTLTCDVKETDLFLSELHTLLWIKMDKDRTSSRASSEPLLAAGTHNLTLRRAAAADAGQYLCAMHTEKVPVWRIIRNITLTVDESPPADSGLLIHLCVIGTLTMMGITVLVVVEFRKRMTSVFAVTPR